MYFLFWIWFGVIFISGLVVFCFMRNYLLLTLLSLEFLVLCVYYLFFYYLCFYGMSVWFLIIYLSFSVCEGSLGLGILVSMVRVHGDDNVSILSFLVC